ncbi:zinc finger protein 431-like [Diorhabda sublineata]|uniref:zinc finger protein 431-like n=1 Tax=Diorhabda sublineata TaxID=1163346 RepID=UPI0024E11F97|nr:zinc finger protein 431-like [Diorhabda sublineata]
MGEKVATGSKTKTKRLKITKKQVKNERNDSDTVSDNDWFPDGANKKKRIYRKKSQDSPAELEKKKPVKKRKRNNEIEDKDTTFIKSEISFKSEDIDIEKSDLKKFVNLNEVPEPVNCKQCGQTFQTHIDLGMHSICHSKDNLYTCHMCDFSKDKKSVFKNHIRSHDLWKCEKCGKIFKIKRCAYKHSKTHNAKSFVQCEICGKDVRNVYLDTHKKLVHADEKNIQIYKCHLCDKAYKNSTALKGHYSYNHKEYGVDTSVICDICGMRLSCKGKLGQHLRTHTGDRPFPCTICPRKFISKDILRAHMRVHTGEKPYVCMYCGKKFAHGAPYRKERNNKSRRRKFNKVTKKSRKVIHKKPIVEPVILNQALECKKCFKYFPNNVDFALHSVEHSENNEYQCHLCDFKLKSVYRFEKHIRCHEGSNLYKCGMCDKTFKIGTHALEHVYFHTGEKPFPCEICGKRFMYSRLLSAHRRLSHYSVLTGKPLVKYDCKICGKHYESYPGLQRHMFSKHDESGIDRSVMCDVCGKKIKNKDKLKFHLRIHSGDKPFSCVICGKKFAKKDFLQAHMPVHTGEKPFSCKDCGKTFAHRAPLWYHKKTHTGEKPNVCRFCGKGFISKPAMDSHTRSCRKAA